MSELFHLSGTYSDDSYPLESEIRTLRLEIQTLDRQLRELRKEMVSHDNVCKDPSTDFVSIHDVISEVEKELKQTTKENESSEVKQKW